MLKNLSTSQITLLPLVSIIYFPNSSLIFILGFLSTCAPFCSPLFLICFTQLTTQYPRGYEGQETKSEKERMVCSAKY